MPNTELSAAQLNLLSEIAKVTEGSVWTSWFNGAGQRTLAVLVRTGHVELGAAQTYIARRESRTGRTLGALPATRRPVALTRAGRAVLTAART